jgi:anti-sigma B factor antagonist
MFLTKPIVVGDVCVLEVHGRLELDNVLEFQATLMRALSEGHRKVLLDMKNVTKMDSSGLGELVGSHSIVGHHGGTFKLCALPETVRDVLEVTRLITVFDIYDSRGKAMESFA